ncbi:MAG: AAA family ATPase, partial [Candidatus Latescibacteria bacterium]|nr:AAA family ATPase [Candidatus Latescibacterota bacterium]
QKALSALKGCDYVICDCPPSMSLININVLTFCDEVILPVSLDHLSRSGVDQTIEMIEEVKWVSERNEIDFRILATFYDLRTNISKDLLKQIRDDFEDRVYNTVIRINTALKEAPGSGKTIYEHAPLSRGAFDYYKLTEEILGGGRT